MTDEMNPDHLQAIRDFVKAVQDLLKDSQGSSFHPDDIEPGLEEVIERFCHHRSQRLDYY